MALSSTCKAAVFHGHGLPITHEDLPLPELKAGEVLVRIQCSTLCGSDVHTLRGLREEPTPTILGHEATGEVVATAGKVFAFDGSELGEGDRVVWSVCVSCGECSLCLRGLPQKCSRLAKYGHLKAEGRLALSGGFAEHIILRSGSQIFRVPSDLAPAIASTANCAVATIMGAYRLLGSPAGKRIAIFGAGMLGLVAASYADSEDAASVMVVDRSADRLETAKSFGATTTSQSIEEVVGEASGYDLVIEATGAPQAVKAAIEVAAVGGQVVLVGSVMPSPPVAIDPESIVRRCVGIHGLHNYIPSDLEAALRFLQVAQHEYPFAEAVTHTFRLEQLEDAVQFAMQHQPLRVSIFPNSDSLKEATDAE